MAVYIPLIVNHPRQSSEVSAATKYFTNNYKLQHKIYEMDTKTVLIIEYNPNLFWQDRKRFNEMLNKFQIFLLLLSTRNFCDLGSKFGYENYTVSDVRFSPEDEILKEDFEDNSITGLDLLSRIEEEEYEIDKMVITDDLGMQFQLNLNGTFQIRENDEIVKLHQYKKFIDFLMRFYICNVL
ncbi:hypothetical protein ACFQGR_04615 [Weissella sagaensis]|uniref:Uncharacterized protein n=1 Tax=Weissella sagaensis TaxID=2559928 RepID=A0ABW1RTA4_9LACO|nr:hypothetical protein [Weissella sagaensis]